MRTSVSVAIGAAVLGAVAVASASCVSIPDETRYTVVFAPDYNQFRGNNLPDTQAPVRIFLEKRCGTLDCHGQVGRPFIVYSQRGLRLFSEDGGNTSGSTTGTTETEILATYQSIVALEPERMSRVVADPAGNPVTTLTFYNKPLERGRHKGGKVMAPNDPADRCLKSWLEGNAQLEACKEAAEVP